MREEGGSTHKQKNAVYTHLSRLSTRYSPEKVSVQIATCVNRIRGIGIVGVYTPVPTPSSTTPSPLFLLSSFSLMLEDGRQPDRRKDTTRMYTYTLRVVRNPFSLQVTSVISELHAALRVFDARYLYRGSRIPRTFSAIYRFRAPRIGESHKRPRRGRHTHTFSGAATGHA